jgi:hypothetical protein
LENRRFDQGAGHGHPDHLQDGRAKLSGRVEAIPNARVASAWPTLREASQRFVP